MNGSGSGNGNSPAMNGTTSSPAINGTAGNSMMEESPERDSMIQDEERKHDPNNNGKSNSSSPHLGSKPGQSSQMQSQQQQQNSPQWEEPRVLISQGFIPGEPVNAFGIPQATMRCLELAESVAQMTELIAFSRKEELGPLGEWWTEFDRMSPRREPTHTYLQMPYPKWLQRYASRCL